MIQKASQQAVLLARERHEGEVCGGVTADHLTVGRLRSKARICLPASSTTIESGFRDRLAPEARASVGGRHRALASIGGFAYADGMLGFET
jgi:hypothetical protein